MRQRRKGREEEEVCRHVHISVCRNTERDAHREKRNS